ncbi:MAG TPA: S-layer homology domain-containing protein [Savagea sp.]
MKKIVMTVLVAFALMMSSVNVAEAKHSYKDIPKNYRFDDDLHELAKYGILEKEARFRPNEPATRGEVADFIVRSLTGGQTFARQTTRFWDVPETNRYSGAIQYAVDLGIINGFPDGTYRPNEPVTRGQMAILFARKDKGAYEFFHDPFTRPKNLRPRARLYDMSESMHAYEPVQKMIQHRIANGYPNGTFRPDDPIERGQLAYFLHQAYVAEQFHNIMYDLLERAGFMSRNGTAGLYSKDEIRLVTRYLNEVGDFVIVLNLRDTRTGRQQLLGKYGYDWKKDRFYDETIRLDGSVDGKAKPKVFYGF